MYCVISVVRDYGSLFCLYVRIASCRCVFLSVFIVVCISLCSSLWRYGFIYVLCSYCVSSVCISLLM